MIGERLWIENGEGAAKAHRVILAGPPRRAAIGGKVRHAVEVREPGSAASRLVPCADLVDAAPLTAADEAEYRRLDARLAGTKGDAALLRRFNALRLRSLMFPGGDQ